MFDQYASLANEIWAEIDKSNKILLHCHPSPDGDSVGSALAMYHALLGLGKSATVISGDSDLSKSFSVLPGYSQIEIKKFLEVNLSDYDLFICLDSSSVDRVSGQLTNKPEIKTIVIDHHAANTRFGDINLVAPEYPATSQILYDLFTFKSITFNHDVASCLFVGIYSDTGGFKYSPANTHTFEIAAKLVQFCPDFDKIIFALENNQAPQTLKFIGMALSSIETFFSNQVALSAISYEQLQKASISKTDVESTNISNYLISVPEWQIGIRLTEIEPNLVSLSCRSRNPAVFDVALICRTTGYGNGHPVAAGAKIPLPFLEAKELVINTISKVYPQLQSA